MRVVQEEFVERAEEETIERAEELVGIAQKSIKKKKKKIPLSFQMNLMILLNLLKAFPRKTLRNYIV